MQPQVPKDSKATRAWYEPRAKPVQFIEPEALRSANGTNSAPVTAPPGTIPMPDFQPLEPTATRTLELGMGGMMGASMMSFTIDGREFDADRTDIAVKLGAIERWQITNSTTMDHPFHLHVWPFVVEGVENEMGWKDTVNVPAQALLLSSVRF